MRRRESIALVGGGVAASTYGDLQTDGEWKEEYTRWQKRDLSALHYVRAWADGVYLQARMAR